MILFLPPAPHTGAFFDAIRKQLSAYETEAVTYPGYGDQPAISSPSIEGYASAVSSRESHIDLVGFHTGCLVALELAKSQQRLRSITLVDVPHFDQGTKAKHRSQLDPENSIHAAFFAAFDYDLQSALRACSYEVTVIATNSSLFEPTRKAAKTLEQATLIERKDISKPAFEQSTMAELLVSIIIDNSQAPRL